MENPSQLGEKPRTSQRDQLHYQFDRGYNKEDPKPSPVWININVVSNHLTLSPPLFPASKALPSNRESPSSGTLEFPSEFSL